MKRIGIYSGTFDPVHAGHIRFALKAVKIAKLDRVYFLPERRPRGKKTPEHFGHRTAMIARAIRPHRKLSLLELPDVCFDVQKTLPKLRQEFAGAQLVMLLGSDVAINLPNWLGSDELLRHCELAIGLRHDHQIADVLAAIPSWSSSLNIIDSPAPYISSGRIREALSHGNPAAGLLASVRGYAKSQWLYTSLKS